MVKISDINIPIKYEIRNVKKVKNIYEFDTYINGKNVSKHSKIEADSIRSVKLFLTDNLIYRAFVRK